MKKKSGKKASEAFEKQAVEIEKFLAQKKFRLFSDAHKTWVYDYAIIRLYREFEKMILNCLVAAINNDTRQLSQTTGIEFPQHLTDEVCKYIIVGEGYFDFRGRDGLIKSLRRYLPNDHYLVTIVKKKTYKEPLEQLSTLRNYAAHDSDTSKRHALKAINGQRMASSGAWLKNDGRFKKISNKLKRLADEVNQEAPY